MPLKLDDYNADFLLNLFNQSIHDSRWDVVKQICDLTSPQKPVQANLNELYQTMVAEEKWEALFLLKQAINQGNKVRPVAGPHPKSIYTRQLEKIAKDLLLDKHFDYFESQDNVYIIIDDLEIYNLSEIIKNTNFEHIELDSDCFDLYQQYLLRDTTVYEYSTAFSVVPVLKNYYLDKLYANYDKKHKDRPENCLSFEEITALSSYTQGVYASVNGLMRGTLKAQSSYNKHSKYDLKSSIIHCVLCASGLRKMPVVDIEEVYRGEKSPRPIDELTQFIKLASQGGVTSLEGFLSSSIQEGACYWGGPLNYIFTNLKGVYIRPISEHPQEQEFLIPPTQIQFTDHMYFLGIGHFFSATLIDDLASLPEKKLATKLGESEHSALLRIAATYLLSQWDTLKPHKTSEEQAYLLIANTMLPHEDNVEKLQDMILELSTQVKTERAKGKYQALWTELYAIGPEKARAFTEPSVVEQSSYNINMKIDSVHFVIHKEKIKQRCAKLAQQMKAFNFIDINLDDYLKTTMEQLHNTTTLSEVMKCLSDVMNKYRTSKKIHLLKPAIKEQLKKTTGYGLSEVAGIPWQQYLTDKTNLIELSQDVLELQILIDELVDIECNEQRKNNTQCMQQYFGQNSLSELSLFKRKTVSHQSTPDEYITQFSTTPV